MKLARRSWFFRSQSHPKKSIKKEYLTGILTFFHLKIDFHMCEIVYGVWVIIISGWIGAMHASFTLQILFLMDTPFMAYANSYACNCSC